MTLFNNLEPILIQNVPLLVNFAKTLFTSKERHWDSKKSGVCKAVISVNPIQRRMDGKGEFKLKISCQ